jgi:hypothetical protein
LRPVGLAIALLIPMTSPRTLTSGPPELPGLIAASVWMKSWMLLCERPGRFSARPLALMIPCVTVNVRFSPSGLPTASTHSPTRAASLSPNGAGVRPVASTRSTATSVVGSVPTTLATNSRRSSSRTFTSLALSTTCAFVSTYPSAETMKPEPAAVPLRGVPGPFGPGSSKNRRNSGGRPGRFGAPRGSRGSRWSRCATARGAVFAVMNTTLGRTRAATVANASLSD